MAPKLYEILTTDAAAAIVTRIKSGEWSAGRARTRELEGTVKQNNEILAHPVLSEIGKRIINHPEIQVDHLPLKLHPPKFSRYEIGDHYGKHTDAPWMNVTRTDLSCTLWLSEDYDGGGLMIDGQVYRGLPGYCLIYDCGAPHEVLPVTEGERICAVTWIQSRIRDSHKRQLASDMRKFLAGFEKTDPERFLAGGQIYSSLLRMWCET